MTDFIVTCDEETASWIGNDVDSMRPIVRCRDCKHWATEARWFGYCVGRKFDPDGFCKWGERRMGERIKP